MTTGTDEPRSGAGRRALIAAAWVVAVLFGSGLAWVAVDRAGRAVLEPVAVSGVTETSTGTPTPAATSGPAAPAVAPPSAVPPAPALTSVLPPPPPPPPPRSATATGTAPAAATATAPARAPAEPGPARSTSEAPVSEPAPQPEAVTATRSTAGGVLAVTCTGEAAALSYATPASGWSVEVEDESDEVSARFSTGEGGDEREIDVDANCVDGAPSFSVDED